MTSESQSAANFSPAYRPRRGSARPDPIAVLQGLDRLRETVHERLEQLEVLARQRGDEAPSEPSERERELRRRVAELEEKQTRMVAEARRREQEWEAAMEKLEEDRRLLAEAWEQLERQRVEGGAAAPAALAAHAPAAAPQHIAPVFRPAVSTEGNDAVATAILRQFQALRSDVRKNGNGRRPHR